MKLNWNLKWGGGLRKKSFLWGGMDNLWNYTLCETWWTNCLHAQHGIECPEFLGGT